MSEAVTMGVGGNGLEIIDGGIFHTNTSDGGSTYQLPGNDVRVDTCPVGPSNWNTGLALADGKVFWCILDEEIVLRPGEKITRIKNNNFKYEYELSTSGSPLCYVVKATITNLLSTPNNRQWPMAYRLYSHYKKN